MLGFEPTPDHEFPPRITRLGLPPTACRSRTSSLTMATSNKARFKHTMPKKSGVEREQSGANISWSVANCNSSKVCSGML